VTTQALREQNWTPAVLETRQKELIGLLMNEWSEQQDHQTAG
jgi:hypothetical protein